MNRLTRKDINGIVLQPLYSRDKIDSWVTTQMIADKLSEYEYPELEPQEVIALKELNNKLITTGRELGHEIAVINEQNRNIKYENERLKEQCAVLELALENMSAEVNNDDCDYCARKKNREPLNSTWDCEMTCQQGIKEYFINEAQAALDKAEEQP